MFGTGWDRRVKKTHQIFGKPPGKGETQTYVNPKFVPVMFTYLHALYHLVESNWVTD